MRRHDARFVVCLVLIAVGPAYGDEPQPTEQLIRLLSSKLAAERERATKELMKRDDAMPALRQAIKAPGREVAARVERILRELMRPGRIGYHLEKARAYAARGEVDLLCEHMARLEKDRCEQECWSLFHGFMLDIRKRAIEENKALEMDVRFLPSIKRSAKTIVAPVLTLDTFGTHWIRTGDLNTQTRVGSTSMVIATKSFRHGKAVDGLGPSSCFIYAGEWAETCGMAGSIFICDGDVLIKRGRMDTSDSVIIARRSITFDKTATPRESHFVAGERVNFRNTSAMFCRIVERERRPLGFLKFFELSDIGLHVIENDQGICVNDVEAKVPFGQTGVHPLDVIIGVDDQPVRTYEALRRKVRAKMVMEEPFMLHIVRGDTKLKLRVAWE